MGVIRFLAATAAAAATSLLGAVFVADIGLVVPMHAVWPVTLGVAALLAAWRLHRLSPGRELGRDA